MSPKSGKSQVLESFTRGLLATTCLGVACTGTAAAGTITEATSPAPADFPSSPNGYLLPLGTTVVNGTVGNGSGVEGGFDFTDYFEFQGLAPGGSASVTGVFNPLGTEAAIFYTVFDDIGTQLAIGSFETCCSGHGGNTSNFTVPGDGNIVFEAFSSCGSETTCGSGRGQGYTVTLSAEQSAVPEPATLPLTALGMGAVALGWRRRRRQ